ncbi:MAG: dihydroneopterin aldolase [Gammaproteobacteria bacterium]|nr:dihydroneopterin aldolase [Gammaproteobacteria bacterium]
MSDNSGDIIFITDLRVDTIIGIYDWERTQQQTVALDLEMATDIRAAAASEDIEQTLNYKAISKRVEQYIADSQFQLIETMAERVAELVRAEFSVSWLRLTVHKPGALSNSTDVGVRIERGSR